MKKIMLGTSDAWLMSHSSHRPSKPAYYIEDCRISRSRAPHCESFKYPECCSMAYKVYGPVQKQRSKQQDYILRREIWMPS